MKIQGRRPRLDDFLPEYCKKKTTITDEQALKAKLMAMANRSKKNG